MSILLANTLFFPVLAGVLHAPTGQNNRNRKTKRGTPPPVGIELAATWGRERVQSHG